MSFTPGNFPELSQTVYLDPRRARYAPLPMQNIIQNPSQQNWNTLPQYKPWQPPYYPIIQTSPLPPLPLEDELERSVLGRY